MILAYEELVHFIAAGTTPARLLEFQPSDSTKARVADLLQKQKAGVMTPNEASEMNHFLEIEHLMRLAKAHARGHVTPE